MIDRWTSLILCAVFASPGCAPVDSRTSGRLSETGELIALSGAGAGANNACFTCHGLRGEGDGAGSPRLASLDSGYLLRQLEAYADGRRQHALMSWVARQLDAADRKLVADYYADTPYRQLARVPPKSSLLYVSGDPQRGLAACASCHGSDGEGLGPAYPPLAGQPVAYLAGQMETWRLAKRRNDSGAVMLRISQLLTPAEVVELSQYASGLPGGHPNRESQEAYREAHHGDPRSDASGPPLHVPESARAAE